MKRAADLHAVQKRVEAEMPEVMAVLKVKGFIADQGGEVVSSEPGLIRVLLPAVAEKSSGVFGWMSRSKTTTSSKRCGGTDMELRMERPDPTRPGHLAITMTLRCGGGLVTPEWRNRCNQITKDLQAYLMGR